MKQGKSRTMSICLTDIPKERITKHTNGKLYLSISTWDNEQPDAYGNDFSVSITPTKEENERRKAGEKVNRVFIGNGKIWPANDNMRQATDADLDDLPY